MNTFDGYTTCVNRSAVLSTVHGARVESWNVKIAAEINRERGGKLCSEKKLLLCIYIEKVVVVDRREQEKRASKRRRRSLERVKMFMRRLGCVQRQWWRFHVRSGEEPKPKPVLGCLLRRRFFRFDDSWRLIDFHKSFNDRNSSIAARFFLSRRSWCSYVHSRHPRAERLANQHTRTLSVNSSIFKPGAVFFLLLIIMLKWRR